MNLELKRLVTESLEMLRIQSSTYLSQSMICCSLHESSADLLALRLLSLGVSQCIPQDQGQPLCMR